MRIIGLDLTSQPWGNSRHFPMVREGMEVKMSQIWADASYSCRTREAGLGIVIRTRIPNGLEEKRITLKVKALDNNHAELLALYHGLQHIKGLPKREPIFLITDSQVAIDCIRHPKNKKEEYREIAERIRGMLWGEKWNIYHRKAHTEKQDVYSKTQALTDYLAKKARDDIL